MATDPAAILAAIDAAILSMMSGGGAQELDIAGRSVKFFDLDKLLKSREYYDGLVNATNDKTAFGMMKTKPIGVNG